MDRPGGNKAAPPPEGAGADEADTGLFLGIRARRLAAARRGCKGDYIGIADDPSLSKIISKQGDSTIHFADTVLKFTGTGKIKRRILIITDYALYLVDPDADMLKRRIAFSVVYGVFLSNLSDNFLAIIIPAEYDILMASTRKAEIVDVLLDVAKKSEFELEVSHGNRLEYNAGGGLVKEVEFEEVDGTVRTNFTTKKGSRDL